LAPHKRSLNTNKEEAEEKRERGNLVAMGAALLVFLCIKRNVCDGARFKNKLMGVMVYF
jgi:hypothetical protein